MSPDWTALSLTGGLFRMPPWMTVEIGIAVVFGVLGLILTVAALVATIRVFRWQRRVAEEDRQEAARIRLDQAWNERHRPALELGHRLVDDVATLAEVCIEDPQSGRELRKRGIQTLRCRMAVLETKAATWEFRPEALHQIHVALKDLERGKGGFRDLVHGTQRIPRERQVAAAQLILDQSANAKREIERQYYRPVGGTQTLPAQRSRRERRRDRNKSTELPAF